MYWGMNFSWESIRDYCRMKAFYWDGFFWQCLSSCLSLLLPCLLACQDSNEYGLDEGRDKYNNYIIAYDRSSTVSEEKMLVHLTMCVVVYGMFYLLSSLILKEDLPYQPLGLVL